MDKCTELQMVKLADEMLISDERIIELYWKRDEKAIHETEVKYGKMLFSIAYNILHDKSDCEECQNDTYLCVWKRIPPIRPVVFSAFISKIMRDISINKYKEKTSKKRIPSELTVSIEDLHDYLQDNKPLRRDLKAERHQKDKIPRSAPQLCVLASRKQSADEDDTGLARPFRHGYNGKYIFPYRQRE